MQAATNGEINSQAARQASTEARRHELHRKANWQPRAGQDRQARQDGQDMWEGQAGQAEQTDEEAQARQQATCRQGNKQM